MHEDLTYESPHTCGRPFFSSSAVARSRIVRALVSVGRQPLSLSHLVLPWEEQQEEPFLPQLRSILRPMRAMNDASAVHCYGQCLPPLQMMLGWRVDCFQRVPCCCELRYRRYSSLAIEPSSVLEKPTLRLLDGLGYVVKHIVNSKRLKAIEPRAYGNIYELASGLGAELSST